jgi:enterochelin esterase-like enzyme
MLGGPALAGGARAQAVVSERLDGFPSALLGETRTLEVFLPRGYARDTTRHYPVLYANDGQDMEAIGLAAMLDRLEADSAIAPIIVVAVHATERMEDYGTAGIPNARGLGARAERYEQFLLAEVMPAIESRYRVLLVPDSTAVMGWSLGGLSAFDLAWRHPERFGAVGAFSGSFWWRTDDSSVETRQSSRIMHRRVRQTLGRPPLRLWFESAVRDESADRDGDGVIDSIQDTEELVGELVRKGFRRGPGLVHMIVQGTHDLPTWKRILPEFLAWAFPPPLK